MVPISGIDTGIAQPLTAVEKVLGASKSQKPEEEAQGRPLKPVMDAYVPGTAAGKLYPRLWTEGKWIPWLVDRVKSKDVPKR